jgi:hypothetical protein
MRYGGKKMNSLQSYIYCSYFVKGNKLRYINSDGYVGTAILTSEQIMGSWIEVKDE